ncbi:MAG: hypothetical protein Q9187_003404 [Circinaria calcarea]
MPQVGSVSSRATLTALASPGSQPPAIQPPSSNLTSPGLSTGVKVGIGIAVPVGIIALFIFAVYLWRKDQRQRREALRPDDVPNDLEDRSKSFVQQKPELDAEQRRYELGTNGGIHELDKGDRKHELEAKDRRQELKGEDHSQELEVPTES